MKILADRVSPMYGRRSDLALYVSGVKCYVASLYSVRLGRERTRAGCSPDQRTFSPKDARTTETAVLHGCGRWKGARRVKDGGHSPNGIATLMVLKRGAHGGHREGGLEQIATPLLCRHSFQRDWHRRSERPLRTSRACTRSRYRRMCWILPCHGRVNRMGPPIPVDVGWKITAGASHCRRQKNEHQQCDRHAEGAWQMSSRRTHRVIHRRLWQERNCRSGEV